MPNRVRSSAGGYLVAIAATAVVTVIRLALDDALHDTATMLPFALTVTIAAWYGGLKPGLLATALGVVISTYLFVPPRFSFHLDVPGLVGGGLLAITGASISWLCENLHQARRRLEEEQGARRHTEERERARATELETLMEFVPAAVWISEDADCRRITGNRAAHAMMRAPVGANLSMSAPEGDQPQNLTCMRDGKEVPSNELPMQTAASGNVEMRDAEFTFAFDDGSARHVFGNAVPLRRADGEVRGVLGAFVDITRRKRAEDALLAKETELQLVTETTPLVLTRCSSDLRYVFVNRAAAALFGLTPEQMIGRPIAEIMGQAVFTLVKPHIDRVLRGENVEFEAQIPYPGVGTRWVSVHYSPDRDAQGNVAGWVASIMDITKRKQAEDALREADRRKDEFLATLAHELRNPLAPVRNAIAILKLKETSSPELQWARQVIDRQVQQMTRLIDDLMDVSRITRGKMELRIERVELAKVLHGAIETTRPMIDASHHELMLTLPTQPVYVDADPTRLAQVFSNLLNNAAKYSEPRSRIVFTAERLADQVVVSVGDQGIGIPPEALPHVFDSFTQADRGVERAPGGLGIGLTLVKRLVEMHGGTVAAHSEGVGMGSLFVVRMLVAPSEAPRGSQPSEGALSQAPRRSRVLVVDDNQDAADSLGMMLNILGYESRTAFDGRSGLEVAAEFRPHVALLDLGMPVMGGHEMARRIREQPWGKDIVLIAVTGWGQDDERRRTVDSGFDHHLVKPVEPEALTKLLASFAAGAGTSGELAPS